MKVAALLVFSAILGVCVAATTSFPGTWTPTWGESTTEEPATSDQPTAATTTSFPETSTPATSTQPMETTAIGTSGSTSQHPETTSQRPKNFKCVEQGGHCVRLHECPGPNQRIILHLCDANDDLVCCFECAAATTTSFQEDRKCVEQGGHCVRVHECQGPNQRIIQHLCDGDSNRVCCFDNCKKP